MSAARAAVAVPNALSFSRAAMRELVRGRYRIEKVRFDLDDEGRGEVLYRLIGGGWLFHFFLVSQKLPEEQKTDRNFAQSWDAMGVLCQGEWTSEREARLRREVPKQRAGYADYDTLVYARGNRSARLFDHVVDSLAAGHQPDLRVVAPIGYILRTTAFIANGQLGTRPLAGYEPGHPLRRPYHAQFCSAFMLREYVFDLVDHMARARNSNAPRLAPAYRRYLGLGNAAATGLVAFIVNHPHLVHQWCLVHETALARAQQRPATPQDDAVRRFARLLDKAIQHFGESTRPSDGVFETPQAMAVELRRVRPALDEFRRTGNVDGSPAPLPWIALHDWSRRHLHPEAVELLNAIVLELYPDIVEGALDDFHACERFELEPRMTVRELRDIVRNQYGWALASEYCQEPAERFWYRSTKAPRDLRRGLRGRDASLEAETTMDTVLQVQRLTACLDAHADEASVADIACTRPDLRHVVARAQSLAGLDYAELRAHWLSERFSPFGPIRFALSFYGLEKFEAALPKSVRGTFMQGAPIAEDVERGIDGDWPFPLMPSPDAPARLETLAALPVSLRDPMPAARPQLPAADDVLTIAPRELARLVQTALQGHGAALGVAELAADLAVFSQGCGNATVAALLRQCADGQLVRGTRLDVCHRSGNCVVLDAHDLSAILAAPDALDLACAIAYQNDCGFGVAVARRAHDAWMCGELALRCAERFGLGIVTWQSAATSPDRRFGFAVAGAGVRGPWYATGSSSVPTALHIQALNPHTGAAALEALATHTAAELMEALITPLSATVDAPADHAFALICIRPGSLAALHDFLGMLANRTAAARLWTSDDLRARRQAWLQAGMPLSRADFDGLNAAGAALLVPESDEPRILDEGADPLKMF